MIDPNTLQPDKLQPSTSGGTPHRTERRERLATSTGGPVQGPKSKAGGEALAPGLQDESFREPFPSTGAKRLIRQPGRDDDQAEGDTLDHGKRKPAVEQRNAPDTAAAEETPFTGPVLASAAPATDGAATERGATDGPATDGAAAGTASGAATQTTDAAARTAEPAEANAQSASTHALILFLATSFVCWQATRERPASVAITVNDPVLTIGERGTLRFEFDRPVRQFSTNDIEIAGGSISNLRTTADPRVFLATITPDAGLQARADGGPEIRVTVRPNSYLDEQGRPGRGASFALDADTLAPDVVLFSTAQAVTAGSRTPIDLVFSEGVKGFSIEDLIATEGRVENLVVRFDEEQFNWEVGPEFTQPIFNFDTAQK